MFLFLMVGLLGFTSCEKAELDSVSQDDLALKSGKKVLNFRTHLSGDNEPYTVETMATGQAIFQLNAEGTELSYKLIVSNIENVTMAHIHYLANAEDQSGPPVAWLYPSGPPPSLIPGLFNGVLAEGVITASDLVGPLAGMSLQDLIDGFYAGLTYVNVHTTQYPAGEIRGTISGNMPHH